MIQLVLALFVFFSVAADFYIYRAYIIKSPNRRILGWIYFSMIGLSYIALTVSLTVIRNMSYQNTGLFQLGMWMVYFYFLVTTPKFLFILFSLPDQLISRLRKKRFRLFSWIGLLLGVVSLGLYLEGAFIGRTTIRVEKVELQFDNLPASMDGLRVVQFSDLHIGTMINSSKLLQRMVDSINSLDADIVIQSGDLVNLFHNELTPEVERILSRIKSKYGVYAVYGNHDLGFYVKANVDYDENIRIIRTFQESMGWTFLNNETTYVSNGTDSISVSGLNYPADLGHNGFNSNMAGIDLPATYTGVPDSIFNITISHAPQLWGIVKEEGMGDLVLAGHVHSMQAKIVIGKWKWSPARYMYNEWSGLYDDNRRYLYINDGIGCVMYPMRIGKSRPEVTLIELRAK